MSTLKRLAHLFFFGSVMLLVSVPGYAASELYDMKGKPASLDDYTGKGKWLVVMIWASDCRVCNAEAHQYNDFHFAHYDTDATVLGISIDGLANKVDAEGFIKKHSITFPNLIGEPDQVANMFNRLTGVRWQGTPTFLIYSPKGKLMVQQIGAVSTELIENFMASNKQADAK